MVQPGYSWKMDGEKVFGHPFARVETETYEGFDAISWVLHFTGDGKTRITNLLDCDVELPLPQAEERTPGCVYRYGHTRIDTMSGCSGDWYGRDYNQSADRSAQEFRIQPDYMETGMVYTYECRGSRSSDGLMPLFDISVGEEGYVIALGWTGGWQARFERTRTGMRVQAGLKNTDFVLDAGETVRTMRVLVMAYHNGCDDGAQQFRRLLCRHYNGLGDRGFLAYESWGGLTSEAIVERVNTLKQWKIPCNMSWMDAGWHGENPKPSHGNFDPAWAAYTGDWRINPYAHPDMLQEVRKASEEAGMRIMLWFEPERVIASTKDAQEHPERYLEWPDSDKNNPLRDVLLNLGDPQARKYITETICEHIRDLNMGCYRQDFNTDPTNVWEAHDGDNRGITEIRHINGLYAMWDEIRARFPGIMIDNCASGGRRIDLESLRRCVPFFRTDYQCMFDFDPEVSQSHHASLSRYFPAHGCVSKIVSDTYAARSSYSACWGAACWAITRQQMNENDLAWLRDTAEEFQALAPYFTGDFYCLGSRTNDDTAWAAFEYVKNGEILLMVFRRKNSPMEQATFAIRGLDENKQYKVICRDNGQELALLDGKLTLHLDAPYTSRVYHILPV